MLWLGVTNGSANSALALFRLVLQLVYCTAFFPAGIRYVVADGFYSKYQWVSGGAVGLPRHWAAA